ncbi:hypothetical protein SERLA73DRAFT_188044 [Serpula lacrymans var. lacrymans S7.3]|uniref:Uncharacterized protein n=2 Tax=Serpula lacrymans var. lacrymans TaxID=341189 RepID=F8QBP7_SERL3|nr:uncharacterized protein SERLADRAFT_478002 [Serpula lacrymans var. lacrymans S7.9]EGN94258.1 hypothetical protein SERLA73DRAFT_188044 [Serpula lacrymans var. lacrymans S7.3]EGO19750.1 hypothetical protein SERLADRAFT_478002 [Serpula lacrymans var. lacrymans S7.9]
MILEICVTPPNLCCRCWYLDAEIDVPLKVLYTRWQVLVGLPTIRRSNLRSSGDEPLMVICTSLWNKLAEPLVEQES